MPLTTIDPKTALVVIDLQKGIVGLPTAHSTGDVVAKAAKLAAAFRSHDLPVVLVNVAGGAPGRADIARPMRDLPPDWAELVPELAPQSSDLRLTKMCWGAFTGSSLDTDLKKLGVTQIVLAGVSTSIGVETTARTAYELGYNVALAIDAMTDMSAEAHANSVERIFPRLGETATTQDILDMLDKGR
jgi:nicotinamidase-related amidase